MNTPSNAELLRLREEVLELVAAAIDRSVSVIHFKFRDVNTSQHIIDPGRFQIALRAQSARNAGVVEGIPKDLQDNLRDLTPCPCLPHVCMDGHNPKGTFCKMAKALSTADREKRFMTAPIDSGGYIDLSDTHTAAPAPAATTAGRYTHVKRGTNYTVMTENAGLQSTFGCHEGTQLVLYRGDDGKFWARPYTEFFDGRFVPETPGPAQPVAVEVQGVEVSRRTLRRIVDATWNEVTQSEEVPCTQWADRIIDSVLNPGPAQPGSEPERAAGDAGSVRPSADGPLPVQPSAASPALGPFPRYDPDPAPLPDASQGKACDEVETVARAIALADSREYIMATSDSSELGHATDADWQEWTVQAEAAISAVRCYDEKFASAPAAPPAQVEGNRTLDYIRDNREALIAAALRIISEPNTPPESGLRECLRSWFWKNTDLVNVGREDAFINSLCDALSRPSQPVTTVGDAESFKVLPKNMVALHTIMMRCRAASFGKSEMHPYPLLRDVAREIDVTLKLLDTLRAEVTRLQSTGAKP